MTNGQVLFDFNCGENVSITAINTPGVIDAMMIDGHNKSYRVVYWVNCERKATWMDANELTHRH